MPIPFFIDIGWFYLAARDAYFSGLLPLTGITTSVIWLHQGPLYTYLLIPFFVLFNWHPISGVVLSGICYLASDILIYWASRLYFDRRTGIIAAALYAVSPLLIAYAFMPYVTSLVPAFSLIFLILLKKQRYFLAFLFLGFLYQLERISILFWPGFLYQLYIQKRDFHFSDVTAFILGSLPLVLAGPVEFFGPFLFVVYKLIILIKSPPFDYLFYFNLLNQLSLPVISTIILFSSLIYLFIKNNKFKYWIILPFLGLYFAKTTSEAYFIQLIPLLLMSMAYFLSKQPLSFLYLYFLFAFCYLLLTGLPTYGLTLSDKTNLVKQIGYYPKEIKIIGPNQEFSNVSDPYKYLFWYYYRTPIPNTSVVINETINSVSLRTK